MKHLFSSYFEQPPMPSSTSPFATNGPLLLAWLSGITTSHSSSPVRAFNAIRCALLWKITLSS